MEAIYFDEGVRNAKRQQLETKALDVRLTVLFNTFYYYLANSPQPTCIF